MSEEQSNCDRKQELVEKLRETLQEKSIDKERCQKSLEKYLEEQNGLTANKKKSNQRQFQLGNGQRSRKPLEAAAHLLQREYGDSFLFQEEGESIFIPPVFVSKHHVADHIQDEEMLSEIKTQYDQLMDNHWFKKELNAFFREQKRKQKLPNNNGSIPNAINNHDFEDWMLRVKIKYLLHDELENEDLRQIPFTMRHHSTESFVRDCFEKFSKKNLSNSLKIILETMDNLERLNELLDEEIGKRIYAQETIKYFFELEIPQGELVTSLDYDFVNHIKENTENEEMPQWFRGELQKFLEEHSDGINQKQLKIWIANIKQNFQNEISAPGPAANVIEWLDKVKDVRDDEEIEQWFFNALKDNRDLLKDCVVLRSVDIKAKGFGGAEFDLFIFAHSCKQLVAVELKRSATEQNILGDKKGIVDQIKTRLELIQNHFGDILDGWKFIPVFGYHSEKDPFNLHEEFKEHVNVINTSTDIRSWLQRMLENGSATDSKDSLKKIVQIFIYIIHNTKSRPITAVNWFDYIRDTIEAVSNESNIIFYSKQQLDLFCMKSQYQNLLISGHHGTGKSLLLQEKAKQLKKQHNENIEVKYLVMAPEQKLEGIQDETYFLFHQHLKYRSEKKDLKGISVEFVNKDVNKGNLMKTSDQMTAIFCDEFKGNPNDIISESNNKKWVWLAPDLDKHNRENDSSSFQTFHLDYNLRNCKSITKAGIEEITDEYENIFGKPKVLANFPCGKGPQLCTDLEDALIKAKENTKGGILLIVPPYNDTRLMEMVRNKVESCVSSSLKPSLLSKKGEKAYQSLISRGTRTVLIVPYYSVYGFEWHNVIAILPPAAEDKKYQKLPYTALNTIMRCTVNLFTVPFDLESFVVG